MTEAAPLLYADVHEPREICTELRRLGAHVEVRKITPGDYVIGEVAVERKTIRDFFSSMLNTRLFEQLQRLRETYPVALLLLEGDMAEVAEYRNPGAFWGAFISIALNLQIPILFAPDHEQSARALHTLYQRQGKDSSEYGLRHKPKLMSLQERQRFIVQGLPNVGEILSRNLLEHFGSARRVFQATEGDLIRVAKIGPLKAAQITGLLDSPYEGPQRHIGGAATEAGPRES